ncbi:MAG: XTP/dITP diphosphatase [Deltaproteobacteria bacterium]|nr:XTP/dITP diphosphatase [Deltaproteobacteria bacterium]
MMKIVLATRNRGKIEEIKELLKGCGFEMLTLDDFPGLALPPEDMRDFKGNALKKARSVASKTGIPSLADDSGLCVDALQGGPGVHSARYAGKGATDSDNYEKLLKELKNIPPGQRTARFVCVAALATPGGREKTFDGSLEGVIGNEPRGEYGFGYDPVFIVPGPGKTLAELSPEEKNMVSHRAKALGRLKDWLKKQMP